MWQGQRGPRHQQPASQRNPNHAPQKPPSILSLSLHDPQEKIIGILLKVKRTNLPVMLIINPQIP